MVPRLIFAALFFCSLASRPDGATRRRGVQDPRPAQTQVAPGPAAPPPAVR